MLEKLNTAGHHTISRPDWDVIAAVKDIAVAKGTAVFGELGVGIGATTVEVAKALNNIGYIHIFDFEESVCELEIDLRDLGFTNIVPHGNGHAYWDSYHWSFAKLLSDRANLESFDIFYIDGAHTYLHDALAFFMADRLLKVGGLMMFDDYEWRYADSKYLRKERPNYMTIEQAEAKQIKMFIDDLVATHPAYETVRPDKTFKKIAKTSR